MPARGGVVGTNLGSVAAARVGADAAPPRANHPTASFEEEGRWPERGQGSRRQQTRLPQQHQISRSPSRGFLKICGHVSRSTQIYANVLDWYKIADSKAQLILTLDGVFVTIVTGTVFAKPDELLARQRIFRWETWTLLSVAALAIVFSIICAVLCLHSQLRESQLNFLVKDYGVDRKNIKTYTPAVAWWFGMIASLESDIVIKYLRKADEAFERDAMAHQIVVLSDHSLKKHRWVNRGWLFAAASLLSLVASGASYVLRA
jgi:hypothetical protein